MIDDFVREVPNLTALDEEWNSTARCSVATAQNGGMCSTHSSSCSFPP